MSESPTPKGEVFSAGIGSFAGKPAIFIIGGEVPGHIHVSWHDAASARSIASHLTDCADRLDPPAKAVRDISVKKKAKRK